MEIQKIDHDFSVCRVTDEFRLSPDAKFCFTGRTDEENSLVCPTELVPEHTLARDDGWKAFRIPGRAGLFPDRDSGTDRVPARGKRHPLSLPAHL